MDEQGLIQELRERMVRIEVLIETKLNDTDSRIKKLEDNLGWIWKTVIGGFISGAIAIYLRK